MATKTKSRRSYSLSLQLAAGTVNAETGLLAGCTVAKANVRALGKVLWLDKSGKRTFDEDQKAREIPVFTDDKFLDTLMAAAERAGQRVKAREDHDDSIGARAGYFDAFTKTNDGRVVADMHLFSSYRNREVVLETADKTPQEIGLSIDFVPDFEILGDRALMRCRDLLAVDIVDEGAITPGGLFLSAGVDSDTKEEKANAEPETNPTMSPTNDEVMNALGALQKSVAECMAKMNSLSAPPAVPAEITEGMKSLRENVERLASGNKSLEEKLATVTADNLKLKKTATALGVRVVASDADRAILASGSVEDIEKLGTAPKSYSDIVAARVASEKCKKTEAHLWAMKAHPEAYRAHLKAKGIYDPAKDSRRVS